MIYLIYECHIRMKKKNTLDLLDEALLTMMGLLDAKSVDFPRIR